MPEILTESFCERCGTRYTFESAAPRGKGIGRFKTLSKGLKNFVMSDDSSLNEALAAARSDVERETVSQQLDAFHKTFNFCMTCRQYTCANCWNDADGRCLTCAPSLGHEILDAPFAHLETNGNGTHPADASIEGLAWPTTDLRRGSEPEPEEAESEWPEIEMPANELAGRLAALGVAPPEAARSGKGDARRSCPRLGAHDRQRPSASFQQLLHVYWRQDMQKLKVLWNASSCCEVTSRSVSFRAAANASSIDVESDMT